VSGLIERIDGVRNDLELAEYLIEQAGVALVPGSAFGLEGCARASPSPPAATTWSRPSARIAARCS
jgi:aspartate/methionine/tyrosine aminotransferase